MPTDNFWQRIRNRWRRAPSVSADPLADDDRRLVLNLSRSRIPTTQQLRYLPTVLRPAEISWLRLFGSIAVVAIVILVVNFGVSNIHTTPRSGGTLTEGIVGPPQYINPVLASASTVDTELTNLTFRGLMKLDSDFHLTFDLAKNVTISSDGKTYTVKLRPNIHWSDGTDITSADAQFTFETIADPEYHSPLAGLFQGVTVEAPDDQTIIFHLDKPLAPFLSYLTVGLLPQQAWLDSSPQTFRLAELNSKPTVTNGPYKFSSLTKDRSGAIRSYIFSRNPRYNDTAPFIDKIVLKFYPDTASALEGLKNSSVDALGGISVQDQPEIQKHHAITPFAISQLSAVFFNQRTNPALKDKSVRIALATAVDRSQIIGDVLKGNGQSIVGPILPGYFGYNPNLKRYQFNLDQAKTMLDQAGWKPNAQGVRQKGSQLLTFTLSVINEPVAVGEAEALAANWKKIGAQVEVKKIEASRVQKDIIRPRAYEALVFGQIFGTDPDPYPFWDSSQNRDTGFNLAIFFNKKVDQDVENGRTEADPTQRYTDYFDFQNIVADEVPAIFLYQEQYLYAHPSHLMGINNLRVVTGHDKFLGIEHWYLRTRLTWHRK